MRNEMAELTIQEAALRLHVRETRIRQLLADGRLTESRAVQRGKQTLRFITSESVDALIAERNASKPRSGDDHDR
jgi:hypothetical protein